MPDDDDALALKRAIQLGVQPSQLTNVEFIVDVLNRADRDLALSRLVERGYECDVWEDPVDQSLSIYAARPIYPTLEAIRGERAAIKQILAGLSVAVEDWGIPISP